MLQKERGHSEHMISSAGVSEQIPVKLVQTAGQYKVHVHINASNDSRLKHHEAEKDPQRTYRRVLH